MIDAAALANLLAHAGQVLVIAGAGGIAHAALRLRAPSVSYAFWRVLLAACVVLPWIQGRTVLPDTGPVAAAIRTTVTARTSAAQYGNTAAPFSIDWALVAIVILVLGCLARLAWLGVNLVRLRRLSSAGRPCRDLAIFEDVQRLLSTRAGLRLVDGLAMPVTFGTIRPIVLMPGDFSSHTDDTQRAAITHELLHVQRRDWVWHLAEELVLAVLWFNPAVWWLVSQIRFAREAAVDELTVLVTGKRKAYIEALLVFAEHPPLASAATFARRRHLFMRIQALSKEAFMSSTRIVCSMAVMAAVVAAGGYYAVDAFPLAAASAQSGPGTLESKARPVSRDNPMPTRTMFEAPQYPGTARGSGASCSITYRITIDEVGRVAELRRTGFTYRGPKNDFTATFGGGETGDIATVLAKKMDPADAARGAEVIDAFTEAGAIALRQWRFEAPANGPVFFDVTLSFRPDGEVTSAQAVGAASRTAGVPSVWAPSALRVGGTIKAPTKLRDVRPLYPPDAMDAKVAGTVVVEALIGPEGNVQDARVLRSIPMLDQAALDAIMQWRYTPTLLNGQPVPVIMTVTMRFALEGPAGVEADRPRALAVEGVPTGVPEGVKPPQVERSNPRVIKEVKPRYTPEAMDAGVQGTVEVSVTIGTDGRVSEAKIVRGIPLLNDPALAAVTQWEFEPLSEPKTVTIELSFRLGKRE